jgi:hypothetical protein
MNVSEFVRKYWWMAAVGLVAVLMLALAPVLSPDPSAYDVAMRATVTDLPTRELPPTRTPTATMAPTSTFAPPPATPTRVPTLTPTTAPVPSMADYTYQQMSDLLSDLEGLNPEERRAALIGELNYLYNVNGYTYRVENPDGSESIYFDPMFLTAQLASPEFTAMSGTDYWVFEGNEAFVQPFKGTAACTVLYHSDIHYFAVTCEGYRVEMLVSLMVVDEPDLLRWINLEHETAYRRLYGLN